MRHFITFIILLLTAPSLFGQCEIEASIIDFNCDSNGTLGTTDDDVFYVTVYINGTDTSTEGWVVENLNGLDPIYGVYGENFEFGPLPVDIGGFLLIIEDIDDSECQLNVPIVTPECDFPECDIELNFTDYYCDNNGTPTINEDDLFYFSMIINGINTPSNGWFSNEHVNEQGLYGVNYDFGPFPWGDEILIIRDVADFSCQTGLPLVFPECELQVCDVEIVQTGTFCGEGTGIILRAEGSDDNVTYSWSTGESTAVISVSTPGLYTVTTTAIENANTVVGFSNSATSAEIINSSAEQVPFQGQFCTVNFTGGLGDISDGLTFGLPDNCISQNEMICIPLQVHNFDDILGMQFSANYDAAALTYTGAQNFTPSLLGFNLGSVGNPSAGNLTFTWNDPLAGGVTLLDGTPIVELCFTGIGANGTSTTIELSGTPTAIEVINGNQETVPFNSISSTLHFTGEMDNNLNGFAISLQNTCGNQSGETCIPMTVNEFTDIVSFQFDIDYNPSVLTFTNSQNFTNDFTDFTSANINNPTPGALSFSWSDITGQGISLDDGTTIVELCFEKVENNCVAEDEYEVLLGECNLIEGQVLRSESCAIDGTETSLAGWMIEIQGDDFLEYHISDDLGYYHATIPIGQYTITLIPPSLAWMNCEEQEVVIFENIDETRTLNLFAHSLNDCPLLEVSTHITTNLRPCWEDRSIKIYYKNVGTDTLYDGLIALVLPQELSYTHNVNGGYLGQAGDTTFFAAQSPLEPGEFLQFTAYVSVDCDATLLSTLCVRVLGLPYGPCPFANELWSGASLLATANCTETEVVFTMRNIGENTMSEEGSYIVIQDGVMLMEAPDHFPALGSGEETTVSFAADGSTYRMELWQEVYHPGASQPVAFVEGCGTNNQGGFSTNFVQQFYNDDADYYVDEDCRVVTNSFDPNDKQAAPFGYAEPHYIEPTQTLEYSIRFQNTGTDTAFTVVIRDTLSEWLDMRSLKAGVSSHPYELKLDSARAISFVFNDILLPDSTTNWEASQGFVEFRVNSIADVPLKTVVENTAAIYFDFNEPIITNMTYHTLGRNFIDVISWVSSADVLGRWQVFPNPASHQINIIQTKENKETIFLLSDALGRQQKRIKLSLGKTTVDLTQLHTGWYTFQVLSLEGQLLGSGKLVKN